MIISSGLSDHRSGFSFEREAGFPYWTMGLNFTGHMIGSSRGVSYRSKPYSFGLMHPDTPYRNRLAPDCERHTSVWFIFMPRKEWLPLLDFPQLSRGYIRLDASGFKQRLQIRRHLEHAHTLFQAKGRHAALRAMHAMEAAFLLLHDNYSDQHQQDNDERIQRAAEYLNMHASEHVSVDQLAANAHLSNSRFAHLFKASMGMSPIQYHEQCRMRDARALLIANELSIQEIAEALGYDSPFHFSKRFKHWHKTAPSFFRQRMYQEGFLEQYE